MKRTLGFQLGIYALCVALVSVLWERPTGLALCYVVISVLMLLRSHTTSDAVFYLVAFTLGPAGEAVAVRCGAWQYARPLYLVPIWLPFLWGIAALNTKKVSEALETWLTGRIRAGADRQPLSHKALADSRSI